MAADGRTQITYFYERWRAISAGIIETANTTFLLLIAVRWFEAGPWAKALLASGGSLGLILSPLLVKWVEASGRPIAQAAAAVARFGAACFVITAVLPWQPVFVVAAVLAMTSATAAIPLLTQLYQENYGAHQRGRLFARAVMIRIAAAAGFSELAGRLLSAHLEYFRLLLVVFAGALAFASFCLRRCPSHPLSVSGGKHPFRALRYARDDRLFRQTLIAWMLLGFGNLMMVALRVEYLANPVHGLHKTAAEVALLTGVIPNIARLLMNPLWGWLFDRSNFFVLRITLNLGFMIGILAFFTSSTPAGLVLGAIVYGASSAGSDVAWSLWVTKFAPPQRVADYMSVHTFFTGLRGVVAPVVAFQLIRWLSVPTIGWITVGMIALACVVLFPEIRFGRAARPAAALVEEVTE